MPRKPNGALRAARERDAVERRERTRRDRRTAGERDDEYTPTRRDRRIAVLAAEG